MPWLAFPEGAVRALDHCVSAGRASRRTPDPAEPVSGIDTSAGRLVLADVPEGQWLDSDATEARLSAYGLRLARSRVARTADEAAAAQAEIGGKVAVKLLSDVITHKTDVGGVVLGCASPPAAAAAYGAIEARIESACYRGAFQGVLVQEQVPAGLDLIVGAVTDPVFGPLILAGLGGVQAELWGDRSVALAPLGARAAAHLWSGLRGAPLLDGYRGAPAADRAALEDVVLRVGRLAAEQPLLAEMDLNPVRALEPGSGAVVLDARIRRA